MLQAILRAEERIKTNIKSCKHPRQLEICYNQIDAFESLYAKDLSKDVMNWIKFGLMDAIQLRLDDLNDAMKAHVMFVEAATDGDLIVSNRFS